MNRIGFFAVGMIYLIIGGAVGGIYVYFADGGFNEFALATIFSPIFLLVLGAVKKAEKMAPFLKQKMSMFTLGVIHFSLPIVLNISSGPLRAVGMVEAGNLFYRVRFLSLLYFPIVVIALFIGYLILKAQIAKMRPRPKVEVLGPEENYQGRR